jgi:hypothetical protein
MALSKKALKALLKKLPSGYAEKADALGPGQLRNEVVVASSAIQTMQSMREADAKLEEAKETAKALDAVYTEPIGEQNAARRYALHLLDELGKVDDEARAGADE